MKSILIGLTLSLWIQSFPGYTQNRDTTEEKTYCLPIWKARLLVADALRLRLADSIVQNKSARIILLEQEKESYHQSYTNLLKLSEQKFETQKEITSDFVRLADSWRDQSDYYQKRYKKQRRQKGLLTAVTVGLIIIIIAK